MLVAFLVGWGATSFSGSESAIEGGGDIEEMLDSDDEVSTELFRTLQGRTP